MSERALIGVAVLSNSDGDDAALELSVRPAEAIHESIAVAFNCEPRQLKQVQFGEQQVEAGATYEDYGVAVRSFCFLVVIVML